MNLKDLTKELLGKSLNKYYQDTGMSSLDSINERQDLLLNQLYKDTSIDYVEKTFNDGSTKLLASSNNAVEVCNIKGVTKYKVDGVITDTWKEGCEILGVGDYDKSLDKYKIEILSHNGGNLATNLTYTNGFYIERGNGYKFVNKDFSYTNFIEVNSNSVLRVINSNYNITFYDSNKNFLKAPYGVGNDLDFSINIPHGAKYMILSVEISKQGTEEVYYGSDKGIKSEPYKEDKTQILTDKPLMRLPNVVCDEYINGKITRRIGKRDYQAGDENNPDVITDKKVTYYQLETPIIEDVKIDNPLLMKGFEEGHLSFNTLISPEATIRYKITNKTFEEIEATKSINESVKKTVEQTYPTLMSMDMSLLDLEMKIQDKLQNRIRVK